MVHKFSSKYSANDTWRKVRQAKLNLLNAVFQFA